MSCKLEPLVSGLLIDGQIDSLRGENRPIALGNWAIALLGLCLAPLLLNLMGFDFSTQPPNISPDAPEYQAARLSHWQRKNNR